MKVMLTNPKPLIEEITLQGEEIEAFLNALGIIGCLPSGVSFEHWDVLNHALSAHGVCAHRQTYRCWGSVLNVQIRREGEGPLNA